MYSREYRNKDIRLRQHHRNAKFIKKSKEGAVDKEYPKMKLGVWNAAEAATQDFQRLVNTVAGELELKAMDVMGLCEANVYPNTVTSCLKIPGYTLEVGNGVKKDVGANARVIAYVSESVEYKRLNELEARSEMPAIWHGKENKIHTRCGLQRAQELERQCSRT